MENQNGKLLTILKTSLLHQVQIAKTLLANNNIISFILDSNVTYTGLPSSEGYRLKVNSSDYEKAKEILDEVNSENN
ncbi:DUF2007 domain-containing protein [uncultured Lutibacter sp.]|uniref:putative signal transducing protein n=1 Tax=uncultured Lutibacter sp. TaxID=437739 RepID=UPI0026255353|nr:DUF2007 domain-containing protein [uncultured Lutibacter sp.]